MGAVIVGGEGSTSPSHPHCLPSTLKQQLRAAPFAAPRGVAQEMVRLIPTPGQRVLVLEPPSPRQKDPLKAVQGMASLSIARPS